MTEKFTFFWNGPFSQWHKCDFKIGPYWYNCAEQYMMAQKAIVFNDMRIYKEIMNSHSPRDQKALGRKVRGFQEGIWNNLARDIVWQGNYAKFSQNEELFNMLERTRKTTLVEASPYDCIWGIGLGPDDPKRFDRANWRGTNWLGIVLTNLRTEWFGE